MPGKDGGSLEQNTRVFQNPYGNPGRIPEQEYQPQDWNGQPGFEDPGLAYDPALYGQEPDYDPQEEPGYEQEYEEEYAPEYDEGYDGEYDEYQDEEDEDYSVYEGEEDNTHRFHVAMNVFDTASVLAGVVVIFALSALIFSLLSWVRTDITHSFVILQNRIQ